MTTIQSTYFAFDPLPHATGCRSTRWEVDTRTQTVLREGGQVEETTVRLVCRTCTAAHLLTAPEAPRTTSTAALGHGQPPLRSGGVWLYPGAPPLPGWGPGPGSWSTEYLVTRERVLRPDPADVIGQIGAKRGPRGGETWYALARCGEDGPFGSGPVRYGARAERLSTRTAAARWVAARMGGAR